MFETLNSFNKPDFFTQGYSVAGKKPVNEDSFLIVKKNQTALLLVADGVGGHGHGDWASQECVNHFRAEFERIQHLNDAPSFLKENALKVAQKVLQKGNDEPAYKNCGTTLTGFLILENTYYVINIGDSRSYLFHENKGIRRLTKDHSVVQEMMDAGILTEAEAATHPYRAQMTSAIGQPLDMIKIDITGPYTLGKEDLLLAFSDGIHDFLTDEQLTKLIATTSANLAQVLVEESLKAGSNDNLTACTLSFQEKYK